MASKRASKLEVPSRSGSNELRHGAHQFMHVGNDQRRAPADVTRAPARNDFSRKIRLPSSRQRTQPQYLPGCPRSRDTGLEAGQLELATDLLGALLDARQTGNRSSSSASATPSIAARD